MSRKALKPRRCEDTGGKLQGDCTRESRGGTSGWSGEVGRRWTGWSLCKETSRLEATREFVFCFLGFLVWLGAVAIFTKSFEVLCATANNALCICLQSR